jgi:hypothetical protein
MGVNPHFIICESEPADDFVRSKNAHHRGKEHACLHNENGIENRKMMKEDYDAPIEEIEKAPSSTEQVDPQDPEQPTEQETTAARTKKTTPWWLWTLVGLALVGLIVGLSVGLTGGNDGNGHDNSDDGEGNGGEGSDDALCEEPPPLTSEEAITCLNESFLFDLEGSFERMTMSTEITCIPEDFDPSCDGQNYDKPYWYSETDSCDFSKPGDNDLQEFAEDCAAAGGSFSFVDLDQPLFCKGPYWQTENVMAHNFTLDYAYLCAATSCTDLPDSGEDFQRMASEYTIEMIHRSNNAMQCSYCPPLDDTMQLLENCQEKYQMSKFQICEATDSKCAIYLCLPDILKNCAEFCAARGGTCLHSGGYEECVFVPEAIRSCDEEFGDDACACST